MFLSFEGAFVGKLRSRLGCDLRYCLFVGGDDSGLVLAFGLFLLLLARLVVGVVVLLAVVLVVTLFLFFGLVVLAYGHQRFIGLFVGFLDVLDRTHRLQALWQIFSPTCDADELVLHRLDTLYNLFAFEGVRQVADHEHEMFLFQIGSQLHISLLFSFVLLQQPRLQILKQFIDLNYS